MVMKYLDPKADLTFKKIFGNHPKRLISLLNALLPLSEEEQIQEIKYLPTELVPQLEGAKTPSWMYSAQMSEAGSSAWKCRWNGLTHSSSEYCSMHPSSM